MWRDIATVAEILRAVCKMDKRTCAVTEAEEAGVADDDIINQTGDGEKRIVFAQSECNAICVLIQIGRYGGREQAGRAAADPPARAKGGRNSDGRRPDCNVLACSRAA